MDDLFSGVSKIIAAISSGSRLKVSAVKLKPYLACHGLTTTRETLLVEVLQQSFGRTDLNKSRSDIVIKIKLVDEEPALDGKTMCVGLLDLMTLRL